VGSLGGREDGLRAAKTASEEHETGRAEGVARIGKKPRRGGGISVTNAAAAVGGVPSQKIAGLEGEAQERGQHNPLGES